MISLASINDVDIIYNIGQNNLPIYYSLKEIRRFIKNPNYIVYVIYQFNTIVGYLIAQIFTTHIHIMSFAIDQNARRIGYGTKLLNKLTDFAKNVIIKKLTLYVMCSNLPAIACYEKNGFIKDTLMPNYYGLGVDGWNMLKII